MWCGHHEQGPNHAGRSTADFWSDFGPRDRRQLSKPILDKLLALSWHLIRKKPMESCPRHMLQPIPWQRLGNATEWRNSCSELPREPLATIVDRSDGCGLAQPLKSSHSWRGLIDGGQAAHFSGFDQSISFHDIVEEVSRRDFVRIISKIIVHTFEVISHRYQSIEPLIASNFDRFTSWWWPDSVVCRQWSDDQFLDDHSCPQSPHIILSCFGQSQSAHRAGLQSQLVWIDACAEKLLEYGFLFPFLIR